jgi:uncharacterized integral membrane protein (TIGR00697 family)
MSSLVAPEGTPDPLHTPYVMSVQQKLYLWVSGFFVTALIIANLVGAKFFHFGSVHLFGFELRIEHSVGMFAFPFTFLLTDLLNEYYGTKGARRVTFVGLGTSVFALGLISLARIAPAAPEGRTFVREEAFQAVFATGGIMIVASLTAYVLGQLTDIWVFHLLKKVTSGRLLWLRATGSTVVSQAIDSLTISLVLGYGSMLADGTKASLPFMLETAAKGYALKFAIALAITPLIYVGHGVMERVFGLRALPARDPRA